jgi:hypothetical protein
MTLDVQWSAYARTDAWLGVQVGVPRACSPRHPCSGETGPLSGVSHLSMGIAGRISKISLNVCFVLFCGEVRNRQSEDNT